MASKTDSPKSQKSKLDPAPKARGELEATDLDKVTGGLRKGGAPRPGDPCDGGE